MNGDETDHVFTIPEIIGASPIDLLLDDVEAESDNGVNGHAPIITIDDLSRPIPSGAITLSWSGGNDSPVSLVPLNGFAHGVLSPPEVETTLDPVPELQGRVTEKTQQIVRELETQQTRKRSRALYNARRDAAVIDELVGDTKDVAVLEEVLACGSLADMVAKLRPPAVSQETVHVEPVEAEVEPAVTVVVEKKDPLPLRDVFAGARDKWVELASVPERRRDIKTIDRAFAFLAIGGLKKEDQVRAVLDRVAVHVHIDGVVSDLNDLEIGVVFYRAEGGLEFYFEDKESASKIYSASAEEMHAKEMAAVGFSTHVPLETQEALTQILAQGVAESQYASAEDRSVAKSFLNSLVLSPLEWAALSYIRQTCGDAAIQGLFVNPSLLMEGPHEAQKLLKGILSSIPAFVVYGREQGLMDIFVFGTWLGKSDEKTRC